MNTEHRGKWENMVMFGRDMGTLTVAVEQFTTSNRYASYNIQLNFLFYATPPACAMKLCGFEKKRNGKFHNVLSFQEYLMSVQLTIIIDSKQKRVQNAPARFMLSLKVKNFVVFRICVYKV